MDRDETLYEDDFYAWTQVQASRLRRAAEARVNLDLDFAHLAEEVEDLGRSERHAVESHLETVIEHLLKLEHSPAFAPRTEWMISVRKARNHLERKLTGTLRGHLEVTLARRYENARGDAALGLTRDGVAEGGLPPECPYGLDQLLDLGWWPTNRHGME